jgi:hypothetical protein
MITLSRRSVTPRSGIVAAVIGLLAITSLSAATAAPPSAATRASAATASVPASHASPASSSDGHTTCAPWPKPTSLGLKCTGTYTGNTAWNPWTWQSISQQPVVTVSQAKDLTDQGVQVNWYDFTPSIDSEEFAPNPTDINPFYQVSIFECEGTDPNPDNGFGEPQCYMPAVGSTPTQASSGPANGLQENTLDTSPPPTTGSCPDGYPLASVICGYPHKSKWNGGNPATWTGQADFHVEAPTTRSEGGFFNCGPSTPCSLVIVPNWGGTPVNGSWANTSDCSTHYLGGGLDPSSYTKPDPSINYQGDLGGVPNAYSQSVTLTSGSSGGVASLQGESYACWTANRIVIPLSFAPTPDDCPNPTPAFYAAGSPMMETQMLQWMAGWCLGKAPVTLGYTSISEEVARNDFLAGSQAGGASTDMALVTLPATAAEQQGSQRQFTYAPLANSGTGIAFVVDDPGTGSEIKQMVLNQRLLAKLTTQSYTLGYNCTDVNPPSPWLPAPHASPWCDPAVVTVHGGKVVRSNPFSLFDDPEFLSLNKDCQPYGQSKGYVCGAHPAQGSTPAYDDFPPDLPAGASNNVSIGGFLPTVIEADSDMTYDLTGYIAANSDAAAFLDGKADPWGMQVNSNYLHVAYPTQVFAELDSGVTYPGGLPKCTSACGNDVNLPDEGMQASWNFAQDLDTISKDLLTDVSNAATPEASCPLGSGNGCTIAGELNPTTAAPTEYIGSRVLLSLLDLGDIEGYQFPAAELVNAAGNAVGPSQASVEAAVGDMKTNPDGITQYFPYSSTDKAAYPLTMVDYAMVPTCGLSSTEASAIADFLTKAATTGQTQGEAPGELAPGYYPLTAKQKAQTLKAAQEVAKQTCTSPPADHTVGNQSPGGSGTSTSPGKTGGGNGAPAATPSSIRHARTAAFGQKSADSGMAGLLLVLAIIIGVLLVLGGPTAWVITVTGRWPAVLRSVRAVPARLQAGLGRLAGLVIRRA